MACSDTKSALDEIDDNISFTDINGKSFTMTASGDNVKPLGHSSKTLKPWRSQKRILQSFCGGYGKADFTAPINVISPDGALLGDLEDSNWHPEWSPEEDRIAVACGRDENLNVYVVANYEVPGSSEGWSREKSNTLSDIIEIYVVTPDGSNVTRITDNESGDWLPRWRPNRNQLIFESNRDGNSEIYAATPTSSWRFRLTDRPSSDQSPAWGENGIVATFSSNVSGNFEIRVIEIWDDLAKYETNADFSTGKVGNPYQK